MSTHLAILNKLDDSLDWLDLAAMTFSDAIPLPPHPHELALSRDGRTLYASIYATGSTETTFTLVTRCSSSTSPSGRSGA